MIGHRQIVELRMRRKRPSLVFVTVGDAPPPLRFKACDLPAWEPEMAIAAGALPEVFTGQDDPRTADLRFVTGLPVVLTQRQCSDERFWQWFDALQAAGVSAIHGLSPEGEVLAWHA